MKSLYTDFLFSKGYFVTTEGVSEHSVETLVALAKLFDIRIVSGQEMACKDMIGVASANLGREVPAPFYQGFPDSVRKLTPDELLLDQLLHYFTSYGLGDFSTPGHSLFEETFERTMFAEKTDVKSYKILSEEDALVKLQEYVQALLDSSRPLSDSQYELVRACLADYPFKLTRCGSKDTAARLLLDTRDVSLATLLTLSDVIRLVEQLQYQKYDSTDIKALNLCNQDRVFITKVINAIFRSGKCDVITCFEKKKLWNGLLHHIHYKAINKKAQEFVDGMRGKGNLSVYAQFESLISQDKVVEAAAYLGKHKGGAAVLRHLNYLLSRSQTDEEIAGIMAHISTRNRIVLIQLLMQYHHYRQAARRVFKFTRFNKLIVHKESEAEADKRCSVIPEGLAGTVCEQLRKQLADACKGSLGKVYIAGAMRRVALPLQENTSMGGVGVLPKGTRLPIPAGKKIRAFTYWEQVNDIDLSAIGLTEDGRQTEFSWRTMYDRQSDAITYSGDQTSGYYGGSEYFDIMLPAIREAYPDLRYLVLCNNVFSGKPFSDCLCKAGFMMRDEKDSGEVFEPKTVASSFRITCESTFAYLFGIDLKTNEFVWLNVAREGQQRVAGASEMAFLMDYMDVTECLSLHDFATMLATEVVDRPEDADVVFSDEDLTLPEGVQQIRSVDFEKVIALLNG